MLFLLVGIVLLALKFLELTVVATWPWYVVLAPFGLAMLWWWWADVSGYTKKKAHEKAETKKQARVDKNRAEMGLPPRRR